MTPSVSPIPVILFAYARPDHLARVLVSLRENNVPAIEVFCDGARSVADAERVAAVRRRVRAVDWCDVRLVERPENLGLGRNVLSGVNDVATRHAAFVVWEDDLIAVPGAYAWVCAALRRFEVESTVMSVTAWTHPRVTPADVGSAPYFDGRAECWVWGTWARAWAGMSEQTAEMKRVAAVARGVPADAYGADLAVMAAAELRQNTWAVRWLYHHLQHGGLCVRPPWSMVEHIGFDPLATNAAAATAWANPPLRAAPPIPGSWPEPREHPDARSLWRAANPSGWRALWQRLQRKVLAS